MISFSEATNQIRQSQPGEHQGTDGTATPAVETSPQLANSVPVPVTVVVCARNRGSMIGRCLDSVIRANPAEIIVVDGNSTDETVAVARAKGVTVLSDNGTGLGAARQLGASAAKNEYVVFVDQKIWHGRGLARMITRYGRQYLNRAAEQVDAHVGATKINARYLPYLLVSWSFTALGVALESMRLARDSALRQRLTSVQGASVQSA